MRRRSALARDRSLALALGVVLLWGCAALGLGRGEEQPDDRLEMAAGLLAAQAYPRAETVLRLLASRCENGEQGRQALLLLAAVQLDARNPAALPDSAALTAARFLALPDTPPGARALGESLYLLALELGADPGLRPHPEADPGLLATRFSECGREVQASLETLELPVLERQPLAQTLAGLQHERDSLAASLRTRSRAQEARIAELEAELQRIRRLLGAPDTTALPKRLR